jgi:hypothetical protein
MESPRKILIVIIGILTALLTVLISSNAQTMKSTFTAKGSFDVTVKPEDQNKVNEITFGRYSVQKTFAGDLIGTSKFDMHSAGSDQGAGAYVAIESITGTLNGKSGTFLLIHTGTMTPTSQQLTITVVPGCSTGELVGLEGKFIINIVEKKHFYVFEYTL